MYLGLKGKKRRKKRGPLLSAKGREQQARCTDPGRVCAAGSAPDPGADPHPNDQAQWPGLPLGLAQKKKKKKGKKKELGLVNWARPEPIKQKRKGREINRN